MLIDAIFAVVKSTSSFQIDQVTAKGNMPAKTIYQAFAYVVVSQLEHRGVLIG
jgi:hypothetical protein